MSNHITIVGNVTKDPELRFTASGQATASFGIAVNRRWQNRQTNDWEEQVSFFNVVVWREMAENCFTGDTEIVTRDGIRSLKELAGSTAVVKSEYGKWVSAPIQSFGQQGDIRKVTLRRGRAEKTVHATAGHRWFRFATHGNAKQEVLTDQLRPGDYLPTNVGNHPMIMSPIGVAAGFTYGDGHRQNADDRSTGCAAYVIGAKMALLPFFAGHPVGKGSSSTDVESVKVSGLPACFKELPRGESLPYLYGWLAGYFAADGSVGQNGIKLTSVDEEALRFVCDIAARIGISVNPIRRAMSTGFGGQTTVYSVSFNAPSLSEDFFKNPVHREQFIERSSSQAAWTPLQRKRYSSWQVVAVEHTDRVEEVFCAVVPDTASFTLANDILVGNCAETLHKGSRVIVSGRLEQRSWETPEGDKRSVVDIVADEVGPSLRWATAQIVRNERQGADEHRQAPARQPKAAPEAVTYSYDEEPFELVVGLTDDMPRRAWRVNHVTAL